MKDLHFTRRFKRTGAALRHGPVVRATLVVFALVCALLVAIVVTLTRNADRMNTQQVGTELSSGAQVAASSFNAVRADLRAQASQLATSLDLQRAIVANDRAAISRIAVQHHARIHARGSAFGTLAAEPRLTSTATIAQGSAVLAKVTLALPLDRRVLQLVRTATPLPTNAALVLTRAGHVIAGGPVGTPAVINGDRITLGTTEFMARGSRLGVARTTVLAVEPMSAVTARGVPYRRKVMLIALITLALAAGVAARLGRPLARMFSELTSQAETDALTGLANRRALDERLVEEVDRARRHSTHLSFVLLDIDDFKKVNDAYGHQTGDEVLRAVSSVFAGSLRELDLAGRFGGEEFALILPGTTLAGACRVAEQIRERLGEVTLSGPQGASISVTASFGASEFPTCPSLDNLIERADAALYGAKRSGKNRVVAQDAELTLAPAVA
jgi:diguanylate cyclase (GGDEF)-like protein